jgi:hypothetical protein
MISSRIRPAGDRPDSRVGSQRRFAFFPQAERETVLEYGDDRGNVLYVHRGQTIIHAHVRRSRERRRRPAPRPMARDWNS